MEKQQTFEKFSEKDIQEIFGGASVLVNDEDYVNNQVHQQEEAQKPAQTQSQSDMLG